MTPDTSSPRPTPPAQTPAPRPPARRVRLIDAVLSGALPLRGGAGADSPR